MEKKYMTNGIDDQDRAHQATYENEASSSRTVTIPLREYDQLKEKQSYITDRSLIAVIDKIEELVRALRKHIIRTGPIDHKDDVDNHQE